MSTLKNLNVARAKVRRYRTVLSLSEDTLGVLAMLHAERPEHSASSVVSDALRFASERGMYGPHSSPGKPKTDPREYWCSLYGGTSDGVNCSYTKYEVTPIGEVTKSAREMPLKSMPETQVDFRKELLGNFPTVDAAEFASRNRTETGSENIKTKNPKKSTR